MFKQARKAGTHFPQGFTAHRLSPLPISYRLAQLCPRPQILKQGIQNNANFDKDAAQAKANDALAAFDKLLKVVPADVLEKQEAKPAAATAVAEPPAKPAAPAAAPAAPKEAAPTAMAAVAKPAEPSAADKQAAAAKAEKVSVPSHYSVSRHAHHRCSTEAL